MLNQNNALTRRFGTESSRTMVRLEDGAALLTYCFVGGAEGMELEPRSRPLPAETRLISVLAPTPGQRARNGSVLVEFPETAQQAGRPPSAIGRRARDRAPRAEPTPVGLSEAAESRTPIGRLVTHPTLRDMSHPSGEPSPQAPFWGHTGTVRAVAVTPTADRSSAAVTTARYGSGTATPAPHKPPSPATPATPARSPRWPSPPTGLRSSVWVIRRSGCGTVTAGYRSAAPRPGAGPVPARRACRDTQRRAQRRRPARHRRGRGHAGHADRRVRHRSTAGDRGTRRVERREVHAVTAGTRPGRPARRPVTEQPRPQHIRRFDPADHLTIGFRQSGTLLNVPRQGGDLPGG